MVSLDPQPQAGGLCYLGCGPVDVETVYQLLQAHHAEALRGTQRVEAMLAAFRAETLDAFAAQEATYDAHVAEYYHHLNTPHAGAVGRAELYGVITSLAVIGLGVLGFVLG